MNFEHGIKNFEYRTTDQKLSCINNSGFGNHMGILKRMSIEEKRTAEGQLSALAYCLL